MLGVNFWGVRGSIAIPGEKTIRIGGNTPCIEIINDKKQLLIIDAGTGIRNLGNYIINNYLKEGITECHIILSHTHWDHIQGFPFFAPIYMKNFKIFLYGPSRKGDSFEEVIAGQMNYPYYPVKLSDLKAQIEFIDIHDMPFKIGNYDITPKVLNHPIKTYGYRIHYEGKYVTTVFDHEIYRDIILEDNPFIINDLKLNSLNIIEASKTVKELNQGIDNFIDNTDILIYDAHFTEKEYYQGKQGWGHGPIEFIIKRIIENKIKVKNLVLFHYAPEKSDEEVFRMKDYLENFTRSAGSRLNLLLATETLRMTL